MNIVKTIILILMAGFVGFIIYRAVQSNRGSEAAIIRPEFRDIEKTLTISGVIQPSKEIEIKSTISGVLDELFVQIGDKVTYGQPLARVQFVKDPLEYKRLLKDLEVAETRLKNEEKIFERAQELFDKSVVALEEYENERTNLSIVQSEYQAIAAELDMTKGKYNLKEVSNIITATDNGTVLELPVKEGGSVMARGTLNEGTTIAKIADLQSLIFKGNVLESDVIQLEADMPLRLTIAPSKEFELTGVISLIAPKGFIQDGVAKFELTADLSVPEQFRSIVRAGCTANATVLLEQKMNVLALEEKYFQFSYDSVYVEVEDEKGKFRKQYIKTGISDGIYTEILSGIDSLTTIKVIE